MAIKSTRDLIICVVGTTASGKTRLAVELARRFNGEIVSADSRQVFKYMDVGTGKDLAEFRSKKSEVRSWQIPYHCIDIVHPNTDFSLAKWLNKAQKAINDIQDRGKVAIVVGGTHLYVQALVDGYELPAGKPDKALRERLEKLSAKQLFARLKKIDRVFAEGLNNSERNNRQRLVRKIEIFSESKKLEVRSKKDHEVKNNYLVMGLTWPSDVLKESIKKRLIERIEEEDMVGEVARLHTKRKVSWKRLESFGLEYKYVSLFLRGEIGYYGMVDELARAIYQFSRRQMSWLRRWERMGRKVCWVKSGKEAVKLAKIFLRT